MTEISEEDMAQVKAFLQLKGKQARDFVPLMSDVALTLASEILIAEGERRWALKEKRAHPAS